MVQYEKEFLLKIKNFNYFYFDFYLTIMVTNLSYLKNMTDGNPDLMQELINIFISQADEYTREMQELHAQGDWQALSRLAHKAKSSVAIMGMTELSEMLKDLELFARDQKNVDKFPDYINKFTTEINIACKELKTTKIK
jgi:HPt (histidine-containing phosphotransfer) domain-containing protein